MSINNVQLLNPALQAQWDQRLVLDVALNTPEDTILEVHGLLHHQLQAIYDDPLFIASLAKLRKELSQDGVSFKLKARLQAEAMLEEHWNIVHDRELPAETRRKAIADTVRWAGFDAAPAPGGPGGGFSINIVVGGQPPAQVEQGFVIEGERPDV